ncbi:MAG TPA: hypothetical protein VF045_05095, partial [Acidimicrobiales bacterium]
MNAGKGRRSSLLVVVFALAMVATLAVPVAAAAQPTPPPVRNVGAMPTSPGPRLQPQTPLGDFSNPPPHTDQADTARPARPSAFDPSRSTLIEESTTPTQALHRNHDGTKTLVLSTRPVRYKDASGWRDIDLTLRPGTGGLL